MVQLEVAPVSEKQEKFLAEFILSLAEGLDKQSDLSSRTKRGILPKLNHYPPRIA